MSFLNRCLPNKTRDHFIQTTFPFVNHRSPAAHPVCWPRRIKERRLLFFSFVAVLRPREVLKSNISSLNQEPKMSSEASAAAPLEAFLQLPVLQKPAFEFVSITIFSIVAMKTNFLQVFYRFTKMVRIFQAILDEES
jgi:hypothetical protein